MESILIGVHVLAAIAITGLILMQQGKGADAGASFGGGGSQTMFGSTGSGNFLTSATTWITVVFFVTSMGLAIVAKQRSELNLEGSSLISGDLDQLTSQQEALRARAEQEFPDAPAVNAIDDLPSIDVDLSDFPEVEAAADEVQALLDEAEDGIENVATDIEGAIE